MEKKQVIGITLIVIALFLFLVTNNNDFTGKAVDNISDCFDSDNGIISDVQGYVKGSFTPDTPGNDFCVDSKTLGEYYCDQARSDGKIKEIPCEFGCSEGVCLDATKGKVCSQGCPYNGECLPVGTRVSDRYCDFTQSLRVQKEGDCDNNYECKSNVCLSGDCLSENGGKNLLSDVETTYFWE